MDDLLLFVVPLEQIGADFGMAAFQLVIGGLANVVQQPGAPGDIAVEADHLRQHPDAFRYDGR